MSKREYQEDEEESIPRPDTKRSKRPEKKSREHQSAHIDPDSGQKYVFSSRANATTIPVGEESDFEDDADAMAYLSSVR